MTGALFLGERDILISRASVRGQLHARLRLLSAVIDGWRLRSNQSLWEAQGLRFLPLQA